MDHLVFAAPELEAGVRHVERLLGVRMERGGRHDGFGTWNRLLGFGGRSYMEVVAPDPAQPTPDRPRWFGLGDLTAPRLVTWCAAVPTAVAADLPSLGETGRAAGLDLGEIRAGRRARADGTLLTWSMTDPWAERAGGVVPFCIDWADAPHPAESLEPACRFVGLRAEHPDPERIGRVCAALGLDIELAHGEAPRLIATLDTPNGIVELR